MTWEQIAIFLIGFIAGGAVTVGFGLIVVWRQKKALKERIGPLK